MSERQGPSDTLTDPAEPVDVRGWRAAWERQQEAHEPQREDRFTMMFDYVESVVDAPLRILDLACGPGSIAERSHARFPNAHVVGVDFDPILLLLARQGLSHNDRVSFVDADLRDGGWTSALDGSFDAVLSATALHWLEQPVLERVYQDVASMLRPGGVFANADHIAIDAPLLAGVAAASHERHRRLAFAAGTESYDEWWGRAEREPAFAPLLAERARRLSGWAGELVLPGPWHSAALARAGFETTSIVWRWGNDAIIVGVR